MTSLSSAPNPLQHFTNPCTVDTQGPEIRYLRSLPTQTVLRSFKLQGTSGSPLSFVLLTAGKIENLDQAALGFIQPILDNFQEGKLHSLSIQPTLVLNYLMIYFFSFGNWNLCFNLCLLTPILRPCTCY